MFRYDAVVVYLELHVIAERFRFDKRKQQEGESVAQYARIRKLSEHCKFGRFLQDRLVCDRNEHTQKRLLSEATMTFDRAVEMLVAMEKAAEVAAEPGGTELVRLYINNKK